MAARHRVPGVDHRGDPDRKRDLFSSEVTGITDPIPPFMVT